MAYAKLACWQYDPKWLVSPTYLPNISILTVYALVFMYPVNHMNTLSDYSTVTSINVCHCKRLLTHWGRVTHICVSKLTIIGSDNGLAPGRCQAIIWLKIGILLIGPLGTNFGEILIKVHMFSLRKMHFKMSSGKWHPFFIGLFLSSYRYIP